MKVLLVEDNLKIGELIQKGFVEKLHQVDVAHDGILGWQWAQQNKYDVIILDIILPGLNGIDLCKQIRAFSADIPILLLTALVTTPDVVRGLDAGADDYLAKPFHLEELFARVNALWRRTTVVTKEMTYRVSNLELDLYKKVARRAGKEIFLTANEFALLEFLIIHKNKVLSRRQISENIWGINKDQNSNVVDVYINFLRSKIDKGFNPPLIHTLIGMGYLLKDS